jgi:uncharacterized SAM-binding protein YcdF (DUF218 family)
MKRRLLLVILCVVAAGCLLAAGTGLYHAAAWLNSGDQPSKADAIVVLAGEPLRVFYAADLFNKGYAETVYVSKAVPEPWVKEATALGITIVPQETIYRRILLKKGVPDKRIVFFGSSLSTVQEAEHVRHLFPHQGCRVLVVTSPYHVRRVRMIFSDTVPTCRTTVVGTPYETFPERWWTNQHAARNVLLELAKIIYYKLGGKFRALPDGQQTA